jgi:hypothetical protein
MIYLEKIRLQSAEVHIDPLKNNIWALIQKELDESDCTEYHIFFRMEHPGEAMLTLRWDRENFDPRGSRTAQVLVSELKRYGLVHYSAWVEGRNLLAE